MSQIEELERRMERMEKSIDGNGSPGLRYMTHQNKFKIDSFDRRIQILTNTIKWAAASVALPLVGLILTLVL